MNRANDTPLKIAFVVDRFPRLSETFVLNQITGLLDRGHAVDIFATKPREDKSVHPDVERYGLLKRARYIGVPTSRLGRVMKAVALIGGHFHRNPTAIVKSLNVLKYGKAALSLRMLFTAAPFGKRYDIVHCQYGTNGTAVGALLKELGIQHTLVTTFHRYDIRLAETNGTAFRPLIVHGDCFLAISEHNHARLVDLGIDPRKIVYHPVGIDCRRFAGSDLRPSARGEPVRLVTVARLFPEKGLQYGIQAISRLLRRRPKLRLEYEILGDGPLRVELDEMITALGLAHVVRLRGPQQQGAVVEALRQSHIFLLPSLDEVLPVSVMEAHALGLPVLATSVGSLHELVLDGVTGYLVPPADVGAFEEKLEHLISRPDTCATMGTAGSRHIREHFDVDVLNDKLVDIYHRVIDGAPLTDAGPARMASTAS